MVNRESGQLYTIEGFAAALIMLVTAWLVLGSTSVYTPGDTHISDMQLEQLGSDALTTMNTPNASGNPFWSDLQRYVNNTYITGPATGPGRFKEAFWYYCNNRTDGTKDHVNFKAWVYYRQAATNEAKYYEFAKSQDLVQGDHAVRVSQWVLLDQAPVPPAPLPPADVPDPRRQAVLLEVLLWRS